MFGVWVGASLAAEEGLPLPQLDEYVRVPTPRFAPATRSEYLASVFTLWNLLDGTIHKYRDKPRPIWPYGYMRRVPGVHTIMPHQHGAKAPHSGLPMRYPCDTSRCA